MYYSRVPNVSHRDDTLREARECEREKKGGKEEQDKKEKKKASD